MLPWNVLITVCLSYVALLFAIAFWADRRAREGRLGWLSSPYVYTLSLSVYCTAWTFYGAVGTAARGGLEFLPIYLGPTLVFAAWFTFLRKLVRVGKTHRITSIADLISSRYGKSPLLGVTVTLLALVGSTPYIALQLKSLALSFAVLADAGGPGTGSTQELPALWIAAGLALFTIVFGTRHVDANERHHGVVAAIALEAIVKLIALLAVGIFVTWTLFSGPSDIFGALPAHLADPEAIFTPRWTALTFLSATAIICLPRMFQVIVVEPTEERHLATAAWAFPLYLALISLFVLPIAIAGLTLMPSDNPDLFVLTVPLAAGASELALITFLGGFSAATSMVIVAAIALSTMISNHIIMPLWLRWAGESRKSGDLRRVLLNARRVSIVGILGLGYLYFLASAPGALASIGLISFAAMAQVLPALVGALYWRGASRTGAFWGIAAGCTVWAYTLFLPSFDGALLLTRAAIEEGPFGIAVLRPQALLGLDTMDPLTHSVFWSMLCNISLFVGISLACKPQPLERFQAARYVDVFRRPSEGGTTVRERLATSEDLLALAGRILGARRAGEISDRWVAHQRTRSPLPDPTDDFIEGLERELAGAVGSASAHELVSQVAGRGTVSVEGLMKIADETLQLIETSRRLEAKSAELQFAAEQLRLANDQLKRLDSLKDAFLSQVAHELRTPMTSIRSFSEILSEMPDVGSEQAQRFLRIIREESMRLTGLLDDLLDLSFLESGRITFHLTDVNIADVIERALAANEALLRAHDVRLEKYYESSAITVRSNFDRLAQVLINLIANGAKYGRGSEGVIAIRAGSEGGNAFVEVSDRGPGIPQDKHAEIFEKFSRLGDIRLPGSAGLGLPIAREIMRSLGGELRLLPSPEGATFRADIPKQAELSRPDGA